MIIWLCVAEFTGLDKIVFAVHYEITQGLEETEILTPKTISSPDKINWLPSSESEENMR